MPEGNQTFSLSMPTLSPSRTPYVRFQDERTGELWDGEQWADYDAAPYTTTAIGLAYAGGGRWTFAIPRAALVTGSAYRALAHFQRGDAPAAGDPAMPGFRIQSYGSGTDGGAAGVSFETTNLVVREGSHG